MRQLTKYQKILLVIGSISLFLIIIGFAIPFDIQDGTETSPQITLIISNWMVLTLIAGLLALSFIFSAQQRKIIKYKYKEKLEKEKQRKKRKAKRKRESNARKKKRKISWEKLKNRIFNR